MDRAWGMVVTRILLSCLLLFSVLGFGDASDGDRHPHFRSCAESCERTGRIKDVQILACTEEDNGAKPDFQNSLKSAIRQVFEDWDCQSECRYQCMVDTETKRRADSKVPMKYYGKWPFTRFLNLQEPASVLFSLLNLLAHLRGVVLYYRHLRYGLPQRTLENGQKHIYYEFSGMWILYAVFAINSWTWSALFHARDVTITERLDYSSAVAVLGYTLVITIIRVGNLRDEALKVMTSAPLIAFTATHIMYLNFYDFDYGLNMKVCIILGLSQLVLWTVWAGLTRHPARYRLWLVVFATLLSMLLEVYDFPPFFGVLDAHSLWHACTIPITILWWNFINEDVSMRTFVLLRRLDVDGRKRN